MYGQRRGLQKRNARVFEQRTRSRYGMKHAGLFKVQNSKSVCFQCVHVRFGFSTRPQLFSVDITNLYLNYVSLPNLNKIGWLFFNQPGQKKEKKKKRFIEPKYLQGMAKDPIKLNYVT